MAVFGLPPEYPGPCRLPWLSEGSLPMLSMMSISPHCGQLRLLKVLPNIQKAGHIPAPWGTLMRASTRPPGPAVKSPCVLMRAEVYEGAPGAVGGSDLIGSA